MSFKTKIRLNGHTFFLKEKYTNFDFKINFSELKKSIGFEGDVEVETEAILIENGIDYSEFDEKVRKCLANK